MDLRCEARTAASKVVWADCRRADRSWAGLLAMVQLYFFRPSAGLRDSSPRNAAMALLVVATTFLWSVVPTCAVNGYLGGLATDRQWCGKAWSAVALGLLIAAAVEAASFFLASSLESHAIETAALIGPESLVSLFAEVVIANLGWAMGLWVRPDADALLGGAHLPTTPRDVKTEVSAGRRLCRIDARAGVFIVFRRYRFGQSCNRASAGSESLTGSAAAQRKLPRRRGYGLSAMAWYVDTANVCA